MPHRKLPRVPSQSRQTPATPELLFHRGRKETKRSCKHGRIPTTVSLKSTSAHLFLEPGLCLRALVHKSRAKSPKSGAVCCWDKGDGPTKTAVIRGICQTVTCTNIVTYSVLIMHRTKRFISLLRASHHLITAITQGRQGTGPGRHRSTAQSPPPQRRSSGAAGASESSKSERRRGSD